MLNKTDCISIKREARLLCTKISSSKHPFHTHPLTSSRSEADLKRLSSFPQSLEAEVVFDVFDLLHHVSDLLSLLFQDILHDLLLLGVE